MTPDRLARLLAEQAPARGATVLACRPLLGGYSRATSLAEVEWADGTREQFVLRGDPPDEGVFRSERDAEWTLLQALSGAGAVPVPRPRWYDADGRHLGTPTLVSERCPGPSLHELMLTTGDVDRGRELFLDALVSVHAAPLSALPPALQTDEDPYDGLLELLDRLATDTGQPSPVLRHVAETLRRHRPEPVPATLVHGDWQPANVLVPDDGPPLVIDWEFGHVGDPREDVGYYLQIPMEPHLYRADPDRYLAGYRERTGMTRDQLDVGVLDVFLVLGTTRVLAQLVEAVDAVARGESRGALATYLINAVSHFHRLYLDATVRLRSRVAA